MENQGAAGVGVVSGEAVVSGAVAVGLDSGAAVSVFCSHAARSAALARMHMYFFIMLSFERPILYFKNRGKDTFWFCVLRSAVNYLPIVT